MTKTEMREAAKILRELADNMREVETQDPMQSLASEEYSRLRYLARELDVESWPK